MSRDALQDNGASESEGSPRTSPHGFGAGRPSGPECVSASTNLETPRTGRSNSPFSTSISWGSDARSDSFSTAESRLERFGVPPLATGARTNEDTCHKENTILTFYASLPRSDCGDNAFLRAVRRYCCYNLSCFFNPSRRDAVRVLNRRLDSTAGCLGEVGVLRLEICQLCSSGVQHSPSALF